MLARQLANYEIPPESERPRSRFPRKRKRGNYHIVPFTVDYNKDGLLKALRFVREGIPEGRFVRLVKGEGSGADVLMSDTPYEWFTNRRVLRYAHGHVLIAGLGLGMIIPGVLARPQVTKVTVLEVAPEVIALVAPTLGDHPKLEIIRADAFTWQPPPGTRFDCIWLDIWAGCGDSCVAEASSLQVRYKRMLAKRAKSWIDNWPRIAASIEV